MGLGALAESQRTSYPRQAGRDAFLVGARVPPWRSSDPPTFLPPFPLLGCSGHPTYRRLE
jgi:hypothetical protein